MAQKIGERKGVRVEISTLKITSGQVFCLFQHTSTIPIWYDASLCYAMQAHALSVQSTGGKQDKLDWGLYNSLRSLLRHEAPLRDHSSKRKRREIFIFCYLHWKKIKEQNGRTWFNHMKLPLKDSIFHTGSNNSVQVLQVVHTNNANISNDFSSLEILALLVVFSTRIKLLFAGFFS